MAFSGQSYRLLAKAFSLLKSGVRKSFVAVAIIDLFVFGLIIFALVTGYQRDYEKTVATLNSLSRSMDDILSRRAEKIDLTLLTAIDEAEREIASGGLDKTILDAFGRRFDARLPEALGLAVWDAQAQIVHAPLKASAGDFDALKRDFFTRQRDEPTLGLFISQPFQGRMWPAPIVVLSRRFQAADGSFAGIVSNSISIDSLSSILSSVEVLGPSGLATIWGKDVGLVAQSSRTQFHLGTEPSRQLAARIGNDSQPAAYSHARSDFGGMKRIAFFRKVSRWPLYLSLGVFEHDAMAKWRQEAVTLGSLGLLFLIVSIWGLVLYTRYLNTLRASEKRYKGLFDHMQAGLSLHEVVLDEAGRFVDFRFLAVNGVYLQRYKLSAKDLIGKTLKQVFPHPTDEFPYWVKTFLKVAQTGEPAHFEIHPEIPGLWQDVVVYQTEPGRIAILSIDINDRKVAEAKLQRLSKLYAALSQCNQAIVHSTNQEDLLPQVCRAAVEFGGMTAAWIGCVDDKTQQVKPVAAFGADLARLEILKVSVVDSDPRGQGPTGCAIRLDRPVWSDDTTRDHRFDPWREWATETGHGSAAALPLRKRGKPIGNLTVYCDAIDAFDGEARKLLIEMASDVSFALDNFAREAERSQTDEKINDLAFFDQLTGLANRALLSDHIKQAIAGSMRNDVFNALFLIDLDNFKTINDTLGHDHGDLLLKQVASRLVPLVRAGDTVARFGGDEFVLLLQGLSDDKTEAASKAETIGKKVLATFDSPLQLDGIFYRCTASIGVTLFGKQAAFVDDLLTQADLAMYKAKGAGRNTVRFFDPVMQSAILNRLSLERDLAEAIRFGQFTLHYQPQIFGDDRVVGAEALIRWRHPTRGMVSPADFIPLAEETGQILRIGEWVLKTACSQLVAWAKRPELAHLTVAVNVSARQFREPNFVETVIAIVKDTGVDPRLVKLELTESLLIVSVQDIIEKMTNLKEMGIRFSLDDFGTGYSSMAYLKRLPLEQLKIDQSFIRDLLTDPNDAAIAGTIVTLAQSLGLEVIAEGVETQEQRDFLVGLGCHLYQGYLFSRPLAPEDFEAFVIDVVKCRRYLP